MADPSTPVVGRGNQKHLFIQQHFIVERCAVEGLIDAAYVKAAFVEPFQYVPRHGFGDRKLDFGILCVNRLKQWHRYERTERLWKSDGQLTTRFARQFMDIGHKVFELM